MGKHDVADCGLEAEVDALRLEEADNGGDGRFVNIVFATVKEARAMEVMQVVEAMEVSTEFGGTVGGFKAKAGPLIVLAYCVNREVRPRDVRCSK